MTGYRNSSQLAIVTIPTGAVLCSRPWTSTLSTRDCRRKGLNRRIHDVQIQRLKRRKFPEELDRYAGQILAEMLSTVCHNKPIEHPQEVPQPGISE